MKWELKNLMAAGLALESSLHWTKVILFGMMFVFCALVLGVCNVI